MKKSDITRARILEGSLKAMSRYGYDGASMDTIAREGGVNKSLIYYYFKSKEEIRRTLTDDFMGGLAELIRHWGDEPVDMFGDESVRHVFGEVFSFLNAHSALLRIVLIESIKEKRRDNELLDMVMSLVAEFRRNPEVLSRAMNLNLRPDETEGQTLVTEFFTLFAPLMLFVVLADSWGSYFGVSRETLEQQFVRAIRETHIARHEG